MEPFQAEDLHLDIESMRNGQEPADNRNVPSAEVALKPTTTTFVSKSPETSAKVRKRKAPRAQTIEEIFATISSVRSSGLNPSSERIVLTPRSAEACLRCGVNPETLKIRDLESFYDSEATAAVQRMRHEAYSMRRHEEMKAVRAEKKKIIEVEDAAGRQTDRVSPARSPELVRSGKTKGVASAKSSPERESPNKASLLDIERKRLEKVKQRQERELEQMLEFEMKMSKLQEEAATKMERERRQHEQRERERMRYAQEMAEEKRQREIKKKAQMDAEEERRKLVAAEMAARDRELAEEKAKQERLRRLQARQNEEERKVKAEEHRLATEQILKQQQQEINERLMELEIAERARSDMIEVQRAERAKQMEDRRRVVSIRIRKNLKQARKVEVDRKREIQRKQEASERLRLQHEEEMRRARDLSYQEQLALERKRALVLDEARREEERRKEEILIRQREVDMSIQKTQETQQQQLELKKEYRRIQAQLKLDKVERMKRIQEYKRLETLRKLQETEQRTQSMLNEKEDLVRRRKQIAIQSKIQRDLIVRTMENVKITKKWSQASKTIEKVIGGSASRSPSPTRSITSAKDRPKSSSSALGGSRQTSLPTINRPYTPTTGGVRSGDQSKVFRPPSPPPTRTAFKYTKEAQQAANGEPLNRGPQPYFSPYDQVPEQLLPKKSKHIRSSVF